MIQISRIKTWIRSFESARLNCISFKIRRQVSIINIPQNKNEKQKLSLSITYTFSRSDTYLNVVWSTQKAKRRTWMSMVIEDFLLRSPFFHRRKVSSFFLVLLVSLSLLFWWSVFFPRSDFVLFYILFFFFCPSI